MQEIRDLKTRDPEILNDTLRNMMEAHGHINPLGDTGFLTQCVERMSCKTYIIRDKESGMWIFTDLLDEDLIYQEFYRDLNFVITEVDLNLALARGIFYRYHKKVRP